MTSEKRVNQQVERKHYRMIGMGVFTALVAVIYFFFVDQRVRIDESLRAQAMLSVSALEALRNDLVMINSESKDVSLEKIPQTIVQTLIDSPDLLNVLIQQTDSLNIDGQNNELNSQYLSLYSEVLFQVVLLSQRDARFQSLVTSLDDDVFEQQVQLGLKQQQAQKRLTPVEEQVLANMLIANVLLKPQAFTQEELVALYHASHAKVSLSRVFEQGTLHALWFYKVSDTHMNEQKNFVSVDSGVLDRFISIRKQLKTEQDVVRLLNHKDMQVVERAAQLCALLSPDNAIASIRYQLTNQQQETILFALLEALAVYGEHGRVAAPQLKQMIRLTMNDRLKTKIAETLDRLYGRLGEKQGDNVNTLSKMAG